MRVENLRYGKLFHMTHIDNIRPILSYGLQSHGNNYQKRDISNLEVNSRREKREPIFDKKVHSYVPFYFNPRNAMLYKNKNENVVIFGYDIRLLTCEGVIFTDRNAASSKAEFYRGLQNLYKLDWDIIKSRSWYEKPYIVKQKMMAETLVPFTVHHKYLKIIYCKDTHQQHMLKELGIPNERVAICPELFFQNRYNNKAA